MNVIGMIGLSCYILADTFFVAKGLGSDGLAALNLAIPFYSFVHGTGLMLGMGGATRYSILKSQKKKSESNIVFTHTLKLAICFALVFFSVGFFLSKPIISLLGADGAVFSMSRTYLKVNLMFAPAFLLNDILLCYVRNDGAPYLAMAAMLAGSFSNIILDYVFIFPLHMGIFGAVLATGMAPVISMIVLSPFLIRKKNQFHLIPCKMKLNRCRNIIVTGVPSLVTEVSSGIVMIIFNWIVLGLSGNVGVAAYGIIANLSLVILSVYTGIAQGIQPLLSTYHGKRDRDGVRSVFYYAVGMVVLLSVVLYLCIYFQAGGITAAFNSEGNVALQEMAVSGMRLYFTACLFAGMNIIFSIYFASTECAGPAGLISTMRGFVLIVPMTFLLSFAGKMTGLWLAFPVTELIVTVLALIIFSIYRRNQK